MKHFLIFCLFALISISSISAQNRQLSIYNNDDKLVYRIKLSDIGHIDIREIVEIPEGNGTKNSPLNVPQAINYDDKNNINITDGETINPIYVSGYVVGWAKSDKQEDIQFGTPSEDEYTNANKIEKEWIEQTLVIANTPAELDPTKCIIIVFKTSNNNNLYENPNNMNQIIKAMGKLYMSGASHFQSIYNNDSITFE